MLQLCHNNKEKLLEMIYTGNIDAAEIGLPNLIDSMLMTLKQKNLFDEIDSHLIDKRRDNKTIPFSVLLLLSIAAKLKIKTSLTDIPFAVTDPVLLAELGFNLYDTERSLEQGLFSESVARKMVEKYESQEFIDFYNHYVQKTLLTKSNFQPNIHILDCTKIPVNLKNENYENSTVVKLDGEVFRGYKLGILRGCMDVSGIAEEAVFGSISTHDLELCRSMLAGSTCLKEGDILINDRGFISRDVMNDLKSRRRVDVYIPAKDNMTIFQDAVKLAEMENKWEKHPNPKRKHQKIQLVKDLGMLWQSDTPERDVPINACVVLDTKTEKYFLFMTTDIEKTARQIVTTYELRPEIEEDFRQMKDFWKLTDFKSTQYNYITYHIVMTLLGYAFFQLYKNMEEGMQYHGKSLPVVVKNYVRKSSPKVVLIYSGQYFGIFKFLEFIQLYAKCTDEVRKLLDPVLALV